jgi:hypothetical protein
MDCTTDAFEKASLNNKHWIKVNKEDCKWKGYNGLHLFLFSLRGGNEAGNNKLCRAPEAESVSY